MFDMSKLYWHINSKYSELIQLIMTEYTQCPTLHYTNNIKLLLRSIIITV